MPTFSANIQHPASKQLYESCIPHESVAPDLAMITLSGLLVAVSDINRKSFLNDPTTDEHLDEIKLPPATKVLTRYKAPENPADISDGWQVGRATILACQIASHMRQKLEPVSIEEKDFDGRITRMQRLSREPSGLSPSDTSRTLSIGLQYPDPQYAEHGSINRLQFASEFASGNSVHATLSIKELSVGKTTLSLAAGRLVGGFWQESADPARTLHLLATEFYTP